MVSLRPLTPSSLATINISITSTLTLLSCLTHVISGWYLTTSFFITSNSCLGNYSDGHRGKMMAELTREMDSQWVLLCSWMCITNFTSFQTEIANFCFVFSPFSVVLPQLLHVQSVVQLIETITWLIWLLYVYHNKTKQNKSHYCIS